MKDAYLGTAIKCVESGGKILINYFRKLHDARQKNENKRDIVTEVDLLAEQKHIISNQFPDHNVVGEETDTPAKGSEYCWHVDPIDGTVNYNRGIPVCAVSVALEKQGQIIAGAIHNPFTSELFFASKGKGSFLNGREIKVSTQNKIEEGLYVTAFSSERHSYKFNEYKIFGEMNDLSRGVLRIGSASLGMAYLACGRIDGFWAHGLHAWDLAAGLILVREAGGEVSNTKGQKLDHVEAKFLASNGKIHHSLLDILQEL